MVCKDKVSKAKMKTLNCGGSTAIRNSPADKYTHSKSKMIVAEQGENRRSPDCIRSNSKSRKSVRPVGLEISAKFIVPGGSRDKRLQRLMKDAFEAVERVHGIDRTFSVVPVKFISASTSAEARLVSEKAGLMIKPIRLDVSKKTEAHPLDAIHEFGHYIDYSLGDQAREIRNKLLDTIKRSYGYKTLKEISYSTEVDVEVSDEKGKRIERMPYHKIDVGIKYRWYLLSDEEIFARAYAQYIALRAGIGKERIEEMTKFRLNDNGKYIIRTYPLQWKEEDFEPIADQFDRLFQHLGWQVSG